MKPILISFPDDDACAQRLAAQLDLERADLRWHRFPDGESLMTVATNSRGRDVVVLCSLSNPDLKSMPLYFVATTLREQGARRVILVAPYLAYMRQDVRFSAGQAISAHAYAEFLSTIFDVLIAVDPHLHRIDELASIFSIPARKVSAMPAVAQWIARNVDKPVIIGPDLESAQWVAPVARTIGAPYVVLEKTRKGDRDVSVTPIDPAVIQGRHPVVLDDIASSGFTMGEVLKRLSSIGIHDATCVIVHAVLAEGAESMLRAAGATRIVSTNTVPHPSNQIDVSAAIGEALAEVLRQ
jgi:ribose-phosphate pyrophosphokinase